MASRTLPGMGLKGFWALGEQLWKDEMDANLRALSAVAQLTVISRTTTLPGSPSDGDIYIVPAADPTNGDKVAIRDNGAWIYLTPAQGWQAWVKDEDRMVVHDGSTWVPMVDPELQDIQLFGLNTTADLTNRFSAKINKALWTAIYAADGGDGDLFYTMNKELATDDVGFLMQQNWVTKLLLGLFGSNDVRIAVSADGDSFADAMVIKNPSGIVEFPATENWLGTVNIANASADPWLTVSGNTASVSVSPAMPDANYIVVTEIEGAYPSVALAGEVKITNKATNAFTMEITGTATDVYIKWSIVRRK